MLTRVDHGLLLLGLALVRLARRRVERRTVGVQHLVDQAQLTRRLEELRDGQLRLLHHHRLLW